MDYILALLMLQFCSFIHSNGYGDTLSLLIKHTGSIDALPWSIQLDSNATAIPIMVYIDMILEAGETLCLLGCKKRFVDWRSLKIK